MALAADTVVERIVPDNPISFWGSLVTIVGTIGCAMAVMMIVVHLVGAVRSRGG